MKHQQKKQIQAQLETFIQAKGSMNKTANFLNVSSAVISQIMAEKWDLISNEMWRKIANGIGWTTAEWNIVETRDFKLFRQVLADAQASSQVFALIGEAGNGKSKTAELYCNENPNSYVISCAEYWNKKDFLGELLRSMGRSHSGYKISEMVQEVVNTLRQENNPLVILDEADKLPDAVLYFFITLYNQLEDNCGIVLCATDHLKKRIVRGLNINKKGYKEIYSRIGRKFVELHGIGSEDVRQVCVANGVTDSKLISEIWKDSEQDLRRVKKKVRSILADQTINN